MTEVYTKDIDGVTYTKTITEKIGRDDVVLSYQVEYNPSIKVGKETDGWTKV